jgi:hypothetical protein
MIINKEAARRVLLEEAAKAAAGGADPAWEKHIEAFSQICEQTTRTHIAFLGTALLAKAVSLDADVFAVKARSKDPGAYSARGLGHGVLVPLAPQLGINLGVTGREPLNNQPYFQIMRVSRDIPIHGNARPALEALCDLLTIVAKFKTARNARVALRAFIHVRRRYNAAYDELLAVSDAISPDDLVAAIDAFVGADSEGGKRAQAVVAGLMDLFAGTERVVTSRINDPDRNIPGDVGIYARDDIDRWERVLEVRDKPVSEADLYHFVQKAMEAQVGEAAVVAVARSQPPLDPGPVSSWAAMRGISLSLFVGWGHFVRQALFWSESPQLEGAREAPKLIYERIVGLEVSEVGANQWLDLIKEKSDQERR